MGLQFQWVVGCPRAGRRCMCSCNRTHQSSGEDVQVLCTAAIRLAAAQCIYVRRVTLSSLCGGALWQQHEPRLVRAFCTTRRFVSRLLDMSQLWAWLLAGCTPNINMAAPRCCMADSSFIWQPAKDSAPCSCVMEGANTGPAWCWQWCHSL